MSETINYSWDWSFGSDGSNWHRGGGIITRDELVTDLGIQIVTNSDEIILAE